MRRYYVEIISYDNMQVFFYMYAKNAQEIKDNIEANSIITIAQTD